MPITVGLRKIVGSYKASLGILHKRIAIICILKIPVDDRGPSYLRGLLVILVK